MTILKQDLFAIIQLADKHISNTAFMIFIIQALVHISSAYVNCMLQNVDEILYPAPANANAIVKLVNELDIAVLNARTPEILGDHHNSYTFTKHLAEHEIANGGLPATIIRPSMSE